jgi:hypothetical protein
MDADLLAAAWVVAEWAGAAPSAGRAVMSDGAEAEAEWLVGNVTAACDVALPPRTTHPGRQATGLLVER